MTNAPHLTRSLGVTSAVFLGLGSIIGTGVFVSIGIAAGFAGAHVLAAIVVAAALATCNALSSAQLAASHPVSGGTYEYGYRLIHPLAGFTAGWLFLLAKSASAATAALGVIGYSLSAFGYDAPMIRTFLALCVAICVTILVLSGLRRSNRINVIIVSITLFALISFAVLGLTLGSRAAPDITSSPDPVTCNAFLYACALMFVAFTGYGRVATLGEEVRDPRRTIPRAIIVTLAVSTALYLIVAAAGLNVLGAQGLAAATDAAVSPLREAASAIDVAGLRPLITLGAITAMLGVLVNLILGLSRVALAMGRRGDLPKPLAVISASGNPNTAILFVGAIIGALTLIGNVQTVWSFSAVTVLGYYSITNIAALRQPASERLYPRIISVIGLLGCMGLAVFVPIDIWITTLVLLGFGFLWRFIYRRISKA